MDRDARGRGDVCGMCMYVRAFPRIYILRLMQSISFYSLPPTPSPIIIDENTLCILCASTENAFVWVKYIYTICIDPRSVLHRTVVDDDYNDDDDGASHLDAHSKTNGTECAAPPHTTQLPQTQLRRTFVHHHAMLASRSSREALETLNS